MTKDHLSLIYAYYMDRSYSDYSTPYRSDAIQHELVREH